MTVPNRTTSEGGADEPQSPELPTVIEAERTEFTQRLASFGLGEIRDHLLTRAFSWKHRRKRI